MEELRQVYPANPYIPGNLSSLGKANMMLLKQFQFPDYYEEGKDVFMRQDHDRCLVADYNHTERCFQDYTGAKSNSYTFEFWVLDANDQELLNFLKDVLKADKKVNWTGYRVLGTCDGRGDAIWSLELFAKHPDSKTLVFSGQNAPNINRI